MPLTARVVVPTLLVLATAVSILSAFAGLSLLPLLATTGMGLGAVVAARWGAGLGIASGVLGAGLLVLVEMIVFAALGIPLFLGSVVLWSALSLVAAGFLTRWLSPSRNVHLTSAIIGWVPPLLGPTLWAATMIATVLIPTASRFSWAMTGDSANNVLFARQVTYNDGIYIGADENPVPLPAALLALSMSAGRAMTSVADLLRHDIAAFTVVWGALIALTCYLSGAAAAVAVDRSRPWIRAIVGAGASLLPMSWFVTGYPIEYGFYNAHVALPIVFVSWIAANVARRRPALALSLLLVACTLMLAVWSPLVLVPLALGVVVVVRHRKELVGLRGWQLVVPIMAAVQLGLFGMLVTLPGLLAQGRFLASVGGVIPFPRAIILIAVVGSLAVAVIGFWRGRSVPALELAAVVVAGVVGIAALLYLSREQPSPWTYYPTKLAWLMTIVFGVTALGTLTGVLPRMRSVAMGVVALLFVAAGFGAFYYAARTIPNYHWSDPIPKLVTDDFSTNDEVAARIFTLSDPEHPALLWESGDPHEDSINFWLLQMRADSVKDHTELRVFAYGHGDTVADLCEIVVAMGGGVTVFSQNPALSIAVDVTCPGGAAIQEVSVE